MSKFKIRHITKYTYEDTVRDSANQIMLYPLRDNFQEVLKHSITLSGNSVIHTHQDYFGNEVGTFTQSQPHRELIIDSQLLVNTTAREMPKDDHSHKEQWAELEKIKYQLHVIDFIKAERFDAQTEIQQLVEAERSKDSTPLQSAREFCNYIYQHFKYKKGITTVESTLDEVWKLKSGVCQDFAHVLLVMLRMLKIPARYVSGYICPNKDGFRGAGATHAWVEAYIPFYGWVGLDPTNNILVNDAHVRLAVGKNFSDCSPVKGTYRGTSNHTLEVAVAVSYEDGFHTDDKNEVVEPIEVSSLTKNSFRRHQEMQMQQ
ncbi:MAG TPA: transglutaminase family protein [Chryseolinea sp.]|nr:transglutaminase family protein [Chryseolinea sp.]HPH46340.1 transglutaminase family protein [Chryseolinea sp.]HPM31972.1 transglutaminase family protein [Chryseolinea sp.]